MPFELASLTRPLTQETDPNPAECLPRVGQQQARPRLPRQLRLRPRQPRRPLPGLGGGLRGPPHILPLRRRLADLLLSEGVRRQG